MTTPAAANSDPSDSGFGPVYADTPADEDDAPFGGALPTFSSLTRDLRTEAVTIRVRWFGIFLGLVIVNGPAIFGGGEPNTARLLILNGILLVGAVYAALDTLWSSRRQVLLGDVPLFISAMEAVFIGLLCYFEGGEQSAFRVYYFLSLLITAVRHRPAVTWATLGTHGFSYAVVLAATPDRSLATGFLTLTLMAWVTWASGAFAGLLRRRTSRLRELNKALLDNQALLEMRIAERTAELEESQALLVQHEKQAAFGLLAAGIAHEVGNPLAAISSLVQMLRRRTQVEYTSERLATIDEQLQRIQRTLREVIDFSRPADRAATAIDIREACEAALSIAKYYKRRKGRQILTCFDDLPAVTTVRDQLVQVVLNLVLNALDATEEGGQLTVSTHREEDASSSWAVIRVRDDGPGVPAETRDKVFRPYVTSKPDGTGLGLFVCRNLIDDLGGDLLLESTGPEGTCFAVRLPIAEQPADLEQAASA